MQIAGHRGTTDRLREGEKSWFRPCTNTRTFDLLRSGCLVAEERKSFKKFLEVYFPVTIGVEYFEETAKHVTSSIKSESLWKLPDKITQGNSWRARQIVVIVEDWLTVRSFPRSNLCPKKAFCCFGAQDYGSDLTWTRFLFLWLHNTIIANF